tara:strand:+ start:252 stop:554 length:303 start_codon:yes stop_codon:yes gene_type:complete
MKKYVLIIVIIFLISFTTFIKNTSKNLENKIYNKKEVIVLLDETYNLAFLENNYLTSSEQIFSYLGDLEVKKYTPIDITTFSKLYFLDERVEIKKFIENE